MHVCFVGFTLKALLKEKTFIMLLRPSGGQEFLVTKSFKELVAESEKLK